MQTVHPAQMEIQPLPLKVRLLPRAKLPLRQVQMEATVMAAIIPLLTETTPQNCFYRNKRNVTKSACTPFFSYMHFFVQNIDFFVQTAYIIIIKKKGDDFMAGSTTNISIRMDSDLKAQADALFNELGMNLSTAFNIFVRQSLREGRIPFDISLNQPNKETVAAMLEAERIAKDPSVKGYNNLDELFADLKA